MQYPGYNTGAVQLKEGSWFLFRVHNLVQLQGDLWFYVLQDINGQKHFIPAEYYQKYGFKIGDDISCRVDKVNCTGRIFLEPKHPCYNESENYLFDIMEFSNPGNEKSLFVRDILGNTVKIPLGNRKIFDFSFENKVLCKVNSIRKGIPNLEISNTCP